MMQKRKRSEAGARARSPRDQIACVAKMNKLISPRLLSLELINFTRYKINDKKDSKISVVKYLFELEILFSPLIPYIMHALIILYLYFISKEYISISLSFASLQIEGTVKYKFDSKEKCESILPTLALDGIFSGTRREHSGARVVRRRFTSKSYRVIIPGVSLNVRARCGWYTTTKIPAEMPRR